MLHLLLFNEGLLHYLSIVCYWWCLVFAWYFYILIYTSACGEASFDSSCDFLLYLLHYYAGCQYVKGTKQILIAVCVVEFSGLHSKLFWQPQLPKLFCKYYIMFFTGRVLKPLYKAPTFVHYKRHQFKPLQEYHSPYKLMSNTWSASVTIYPPAGAGCHTCWGKL